MLSCMCNFVFVKDNSNNVSLLTLKFFRYFLLVLHHGVFAEFRQDIAFLTLLIEE